MRAGWWGDGRAAELWNLQLSLGPGCSHVQWCRQLRNPRELQMVHKYKWLQSVLPREPAGREPFVVTDTDTIFQCDACGACRPTPRRRARARPPRARRPKDSATWPLARRGSTRCRRRPRPDSPGIWPAGRPPPSRTRNRRTPTRRPRPRQLARAEWRRRWARPLRWWQERRGRLRGPSSLRPPRVRWVSQQTSKNLCAADNAQ